MASVQPIEPSTASKKGNKKKKERLNAEDFIDTSIGFKAPNVDDWADEMENDDIVSHHPLPSAPKSLQNDIDISQLPKNGPFKALLANINFDLTEANLKDFLKECQIISLALNRSNGRFNGMATAEFVGREDLVIALGMNNKTYMGRAIRVSIYNENDRYGSNDRDRGYGSGGRYGGSDNTSSNWRTSRSDPTYPPKNSFDVVPPPNSGDGYGSRGGYGRRDDFSRPPRNDQRGYERSGDDYDRRGGGGGGRDDYGRRDGYGGGGGRGGGERNWNRAPPQDNEPSSTSTWRTGPAPPPQGRVNDDQSWGNRSRPHTDNFQNRYNNNEDRSENFRNASQTDEYATGDGARRPDDHYDPPPQRERTVSSSANSDSGAPKASVLILKATLQDLTIDDKPESYDSIFGMAKPVDTLTRELEIEKRIKSQAAAAAAEKEASGSGSRNGSENGSERNGPPPHRADREDRGAYRQNLPPRIQSRDGDRRQNGRNFDDRRGDRSNWSNDNAPRGGERRDNDRYNRPRRGGGGEGNDFFDNRRPGGGGRRFNDEAPNRFNQNRPEFDREGGYASRSFYPRNNSEYSDDKPQDKAYVTANKFDHLVGDEVHD